MQRGLCLFLKSPQQDSASYLRLACQVFHQVKQSAPDSLAILHDPDPRGQDLMHRIEPWIRDFPGPVNFLPFPAGDSIVGLSQVSEELFALAPGTAWLIGGSDGIDLDRGLLQQAWDSLELRTEDIVIGPTALGGAYLVGMRKSLHSLFGTPLGDRPLNLGDAVTRSDLNFRLLPEKRDIGSIEDYRPFVKPVGGRPCVFFDRDGVVNESPGEGYVLNRRDFRLNQGVIESLLTVREAGAYAIVVTSQKGVGKGLMTRSSLQEIHGDLQRELSRSGAPFDAIYAHTGVKDDPYPPKPDPGMIFAASQDFPVIDLSHSWMIGDADRDIAMGHEAGLRGTIRIRGDQPISNEADYTLESTIELPKLLRKLL